MKFFEPASHLNLAKYYYDNGNSLQAFFISEYARKGRFQEDVFDNAFNSIFLDSEPLDTSRENRKKLKQKVKNNPEDADALHELADIYMKKEEWKSAETCLEKLMKLEPDCYDHCDALAEVYVMNEKSEQAEEVLTTFCRNNPGSLEAILRKAQLLAEKNSEEAKKLLQEYIRKHPRNGYYHFQLAILFQRDGRENKAREHFMKAAQLEPSSSHIQGWTGRFYLKVLKDNKRALDYYLKAYFLDPHFYDSEFAESRVRTINWEMRTEILESLKSLNEIVSHANPVVIGGAIDAISQNWKESHIDTLVQLLEHDDSTVRWQAASVLRENVTDTFNTQLRALFMSNDLRKKGLAAYIAVRLWGKKSFPAIKKMLRHKAQLVRFEAYIALIVEG
jgi:tetratricopeptide (TPR) repeat protein